MYQPSVSTAATLRSPVHASWSSATLMGDWLLPAHTERERERERFRSSATLMCYWLLLVCVCVHVRT